MPTDGESWRLVICCSVLAILVESWVLSVAITSPDVFPDISIPRDAALFGIAPTVLTHTFFFTLGFKVAAPNLLKSAIETRDPNDEEAG